MKKHLFLFIFCFAFSLCSIGEEDKKIDSVLVLLKAGQKDTNALRQYEFVSTRYQKLSNLDLSVEYGKKGIALSKEVIASAKNRIVDSIAKKYAADIYITVAISSVYAGNFEIANENALEALAISQKLGYANGVFNANNIMGSVNTSQGKYREALKKHFSNVEVFKDLTDKRSKGRLARSYANIGSAYVLLGDHSEAIRYLFMALKLNEEVGRKDGVAINYTNIAGVYSRLGRNKESIKYDSLALQIYNELDDKNGIATVYHNIATQFYKMDDYQPALENLRYSEKISDEFGFIDQQAMNYHDYAAIYTQLKNYPLAMEYAQKSLKINEELGDKSGISSAYENLGTIYSNQLKFAEGEMYYKKALGISMEIGEKSGVASAYLGMVNMYSSKGDYKKAFESHRMYMLYKDSINNEDSRKKTVQAEMNFEFDKKEAVAEAEHKKELENQQLISDEKAEKQQMVLFLVAIGLLLVLIFVGFVFRSLRLTRKQKNSIEASRDLIEKQKQEVIHQKNIVDEKQKEIIDSITYARRIQHSLLPTEKYIERSLKRLKK